MSMDINLNATLDTKNFGRPLGKISGDVKDFSASLAASNARVLAFGASTAVLGGVAKAFKDVANATIEVEKALIDINRIAQKSQSEMTGLSAAIFDLAKEATISFKDASKATLEFARQGLSAEKALMRTKDALILTRLTGISTARSVESLTAVVNGFSEAGLTTSAVLAKLVAVEQNFAVSANDLVQAFSRTGQAAQSAGVDIDELSALVTLAQERTARGGAVIGNALKTIFTRLGRSDTLDSLESYGILVKNASREALPATQILKNFAKAYKNLDSSAKSSLTEQVAGVFQVNILKAILGGVDEAYGTYEKSLKKAKGATNEAILANEALNKSLSAIIDQTGIDLERLMANIGQVSFAPMASQIVRIFDNIFESANEQLEMQGGNIAKGLLAGFTNILTGPGIMVAIAALGKTMITAFSFAAKSLPILIGISTETQKRRNLEASILEIMKGGSHLSKILKDETISRTDKETALFRAISRNTQEMRDQVKLSVQLASSPKIFGNIKSTPAGLVTKKAEGYIPHFRQEEKIARSLGAVNPIAKFGKGTIGGEKFIMNNREVEIPRFGSNGDSAVIPMYAKGSAFNKNKFPLNQVYPEKALSGITANLYIQEKAIRDLARKMGQSYNDFSTVVARFPRVYEKDLRQRETEIRNRMKLENQSRAQIMSLLTRRGTPPTFRKPMAMSMSQLNEQFNYQAFQRNQLPPMMGPRVPKFWHPGGMQGPPSSLIPPPVPPRPPSMMRRAYDGTIKAGKGGAGLAWQLGAPTVAGMISQSFEKDSRGEKAANMAGSMAGIGGMLGSVMPGLGPIIGTLVGTLLGLGISLTQTSTEVYKKTEKLKKETETFAQSASFGGSFIDSVAGISKLKREGAEGPKILRAESESLKISEKLRNVNKDLYESFSKTSGTVEELNVVLDAYKESESRKLAQSDFVLKASEKGKWFKGETATQAFDEDQLRALATVVPRFVTQTSTVSGLGEVSTKVLSKESAQEIKIRAVMAASSTGRTDEEFTSMVDAITTALINGAGEEVKKLFDNVDKQNGDLTGVLEKVSEAKESSRRMSRDFSAASSRDDFYSKIIQQTFDFNQNFDKLIKSPFDVINDTLKLETAKLEYEAKSKLKMLMSDFADSSTSLADLFEGQYSDIITLAQEGDLEPLKSLLKNTKGEKAKKELEKVIELEGKRGEIAVDQARKQQLLNNNRKNNTTLADRELMRFNEYVDSQTNAGNAERARTRSVGVLDLEEMALQRRLSDPQSFLGKGMIAKAQAQNAIQSKINANQQAQSFSGKYSSAENSLRDFRSSKFALTGKSEGAVGTFNTLGDLEKARKEMEAFKGFAPASAEDKDRLKRIQEIKSLEVDISTEINLRNEKQKEDAERSLSEARRLTSFRGGYNDSMQEMKNSVDTFEYTLGNKIPTLFRDGMVDAIQTAMNESDNLGDALSGIARTFLLEIQRAFIGQAVNSVVSGFGNFGNVKTSQKGGIIQAQNGMFLGGNRTGDRNPALLEDGEYVLNRNAVKGLGGPSEIDKLNFGAFPRFANGGSYSGSLSVPLDKLSGFGRENSPEYNEFLDSEREKFQKSLAKKAATRALLVSLLSTAVSAGVSYGMSSYSASKSQGHAMSPGTRAELIRRDNVSRFAESAGAKINTGSIMTQQSGGFIASGSRLRDSVPAFLSGGEFVVNSRAVRKYGVGGLNRINSGVRGFQDGGLVGGGGEVTNPSNNIDSSKTNDVTINITINNSSKGSSQEQSQSGTGDKDPSMLLAAKVKESVYQIIMTEQRSGGLLESTRRQ